MKAERLFAQISRAQQGMDAGQDDAGWTKAGDNPDRSQVPTSIFETGLQATGGMYCVVTSKVPPCLAPFLDLSMSSSRVGFCKKFEY